MSVPDPLHNLIIWLIALIGPCAFVITFDYWEGSILPGRIPQDEIDAVVDELIEHYGEDAETAAAAEEAHYGWYCNDFEQGKWCRIRREIARRRRHLY